MAGLPCRKNLVRMAAALADGQTKRLAIAKIGMRTNANSFMTRSTYLMPTSFDRLLSYDQLSETSSTFFD